MCYNLTLTQQLIIHMAKLSFFPLFTLTSLALIAFAGNSVLCRLALANGAIDANSFTIVRFASGALTLFLLLALQQGVRPFSRALWQARNTNIKQASFLFLYGVCFSFAYVILDTGSGALILFASVQFTLLAIQFIYKTPPNMQEMSGLLLAFMGFVYWMLPSSQPPSYMGAALMVVSGMSWAAYSYSGSSSTHAQQNTAFNFILTLPLLILVLPLYGVVQPFNISIEGLLLAVTSGSITSALGYWLWFKILPSISLTSAAILQLSVPILAALGGIIWNQDSISNSFIIACGFILIGIYLVISAKKPKPAAT